MLIRQILFNQLLYHQVLNNLLIKRQNWVLSSQNPWSLPLRPWNHFWTTPMYLGDPFIDWYVTLKQIISLGISGRCLHSFGFYGSVLSGLGFSKFFPNCFPSSLWSLSLVSVGFQEKNSFINVRFKLAYQKQHYRPKTSPWVTTEDINY